jgi:hypothetical protein
MTEFRYELRRAIYVRDRDGDFATWYRGWCRKGYTMTDLNISEPDIDRRVGRAFQAQGPLKAIVINSR